MEGRISRSPERLHRRRVLLLLGVALTTVAAAATISVYVPIVPHDFSGSIVRYGCPPGGGCATPAENRSIQAFPTGSSVQFHWISVNAVLAAFQVTDRDGSSLLQCSEQGLAGSCGFTSDGGEYEFNFDWSGNLSSATVTYTGTYSAPLL